MLSFSENFNENFDSEICTKYFSCNSLGYDNRIRVFIFSNLITFCDTMIIFIVDTTEGIMSKRKYNFSKTGLGQWNYDTDVCWKIVGGN